MFKYTNDQKTKIIAAILTAAKNNGLNVGFLSEGIKCKYDKKCNYVELEKQEFVEFNNYRVNIVFAVPNTAKTGKMFNRRTLIGKICLQDFKRISITVNPYMALTKDDEGYNVEQNTYDRLHRNITDIDEFVSYCENTLDDLLKDTLTVWKEYVESQRQLALLTTKWNTMLSLDGVESW